MTYESVKSALQSEMPSFTPKPFIHATASSIGELASCIILAPAELIKQNAQMLQQSDRPSGRWATSVEALRMIRRSPNGAAHNLWAGYVALVARNLPFTAINFPLFELFRAQIWSWRRQPTDSMAQTIEKLDPRSENWGVLNAEAQAREKQEGRAAGILETGMVTGASASLSSAVAALVTTPADVIKTRIMLSSGDQSTPAERRQVSGGGTRKTTALGVARVIVHDKGIRGLFRGGTLRASWAAVGGGLYLGSYEAAKVSLRRANRDAQPDERL